jgi:hypothetical protein
MPVLAVVKREARSVLLTTAFFVLWIGPLFLIKVLLLAEYHPTGYGVGSAVVGVLLLAKVVVVLERVPLGRKTPQGVSPRPAWVDVLLRTALYACGVVIALTVERGLRGVLWHDGFLNAIRTDVQTSGAHHIAANALAITAGLLAFNALSVLRRNLGPGALRRMFLSPCPAPRASE